MQIWEALFHTEKRLSYRSMLAWLVACVLLLAHEIDEQTWLWVTSVFISGEAVREGIKRSPR